jgi:hypothetical protein
LKVVPGGMMSVTTTPVPGAGPTLETTIVYVTGSPVPYGGADAVFEIERSVALETLASSAPQPAIRD